MKNNIEETIGKYLPNDITFWRVWYRVTLYSIRALLPKLSEVYIPLNQVGLIFAR